MRSDPIPNSPPLSLNDDRLDLAKAADGTSIEKEVSTYPSPPKTAIKCNRSRDRARVACCYCRARKVRCDVVHGTPCMQCRLDKVRCVVASRKVVPKNSTQLHIAQSSDASHSTAARMELAVVQSLTLLSNTLESFVDRPQFLGTIHRPPNPCDHGMFTTSLKVQLLAGYLHYVYPLIPAIDSNALDEQIGIESSKRSKGRRLVSLAAMYAGIPHVDPLSFEAAGFSSPMTAAESLRVQFKLIYDCNSEVDIAAVANALLLMSSWYSAGSRLESIEWSTTAISMMGSTTLYDSFNNREALTEDPQVRRLWWSCFIRDQSVALKSMQRPNMVYSPHLMPIIGMKDFKLLSINCQENPNAPSSRISDLPISPSLARERQAAIVFIEMAKQSTLLNQALILKVHQPPQDGSCVNSVTNTMLEDSEVWQQKLPQEAVYMHARKTTDSKAHKDSTEPAMIHSGSLEIMHSLTQMVIHDIRKTVIKDKTGCLNRRSVASAAVVQILQDYSRTSSAHHLTTHIVELVLPLVISKFLRLESVRRCNTETCLDGFGKGLEIWKEFCEQRLEKRSQHGFKTDFLDHILQSMLYREDNNIFLTLEEDDAISATDSTEAPIMSFANGGRLSVTEAMVEEVGEILPGSLAQARQDYNLQSSEGYTPSWSSISENDFDTLFNPPD